jgi:hypothetical protein
VIDWDDREHDPRYRALRVCREHFGIYDGLDDPDLERRQRCHDGADEDRWFGSDFNEWIHLCHCCVADVTRSGSRWSSFYCDDCHRRVVAVHRTTGIPIPLGRHSMMNGVGLAGRNARAPGAVEAFGTALDGMASTIERSYAWRRERIALLIAEGEDDPTLPDLAARALRAWTKEEAFHAMVTWWRGDDPPDRPADTPPSPDPGLLLEEPATPVPVSPEARSKMLRALSAYVRHALEGTVDLLKDSDWFVDGMRVCRFHGALYHGGGPWAAAAPIDRCRRCRPESPPPQRLQEQLDLCPCCIMDVVPSGYPTASLYCGECHERVEAAVTGAGPTDLPLGLDPRLNGRPLLVVEGEPFDPGQPDWVRHLEAVARLRSWRWRRLWAATYGMEGDPLVDQVIGLAARRWTKAQSYDEMVAWWLDPGRRAYDEPDPAPSPAPASARPQRRGRRALG